MSSNTKSVEALAAAAAPVAAPVAAPAAAVVPMLTAEMVAQACYSGVRDFEMAKEAAIEKARMDSIVQRYLMNPKSTTELVVAWTLRVIIIAGVAMLAIYAGERFLKFVQNRRDAAAAAAEAGVLLG